MSVGHGALDQRSGEAAPAAVDPRRSTLQDGRVQAKGDESLATDHKDA